MPFFEQQASNICLKFQLNVQIRQYSIKTDILIVAVH